MNCLIILLLCIITKSLSIRHRFHNISYSNGTHESFLRAYHLLNSGSCRHIYLDMGTNKGIQIRKLYEPEKYPNSPILPVYEKYFGSGDRKDVCSFGFEPNPDHTNELIKLEDDYKRRGQHAVVFKETVVSNYNGQATLFHDAKKNKKSLDLAASIFIFNRNMSTSENVTVGSIDIAMFLHSFILNRLGQTNESRIVAKVDIEGAEYIVLPHLFNTGRALCGIDFAYVEYHPMMTEFVMELNRNISSASLTRSCKTEVVELDDELYMNGTGDIKSSYFGRYLLYIIAGVIVIAIFCLKSSKKKGFRF